MQTILWEWINFALRWTHVIAGIALDRQLVLLRPPRPRA